MPRRPRVYIPKRSFHDFREAERFGDLVFLTEGYVRRFNVNHIYRLCHSAMQNAEATDLLLVSSLIIINAAAASILAHRFGRVNYLLYDSKAGKYVIREIMLNGDHTIHQDDANQSSRDNSAL